MKKTLVLGANLIMGLFFVLFAAYTPAEKETGITITNIRSAKGKIIVQIFKDEAGYEDNKAFKKLTIDKKNIAGGNLKISLAIEPGTYGLSMIDDENENGQLDKNFIGVPKEGFGFSNFFMEKLKKPKFDEFKVDTKAGTNITMKVKYL